MRIRNDSADASFYYHEDATADVARIDSSAVFGNLADAMKKRYGTASVSSDYPESGDKLAGRSEFSPARLNPYK